MKKLAVFVEGYTEVVFVEKLLEEIAGNNNVLIDHKEIRGGGRSARSFARVRAARKNTGQKYYVLIVDCGGDKLVKTRILEEHENLTNACYTKIIGMRDVRPDFVQADIPRLERELPVYIKTKLIPVEFILAIMETEAWFLAETTHFLKIDPAITVPAIITALAFDPANDDMEKRLSPAEDLNNCYVLGGKTYQKYMAQKTIDALDFALVYCDLCNKFTYLAKLIAGIVRFLS